MKKYALIIDYKTSFKNGFTQILLNSNNLLEAMEEGEKHLNETVYLITICEKTDKITYDSKLKTVIYKEIITNRGNGWRNTENPCKWKLETVKGYQFESWSII